MSEAKYSSKVQKSFRDRVQNNVDLAQSKDLSLTGQGCKFGEDFYEHKR